MKRRESSLAACAILFAAMALCYWRFFAGFAPAGRDIVLQYLPYQQLIRQSVWRGEWPMWNAMTFCGRPLMGDVQVGVLYPPNWLHWLLPLPLSFTLLFLGHTMASLWGCFRLARLWRLSEPAAALFAILYTLGGFFTSKMQTGIVLFHYVAAWLPWEGIALMRLMRAPSLPRAAALALALAMALLAGSPQMTFFSYLIVGVMTVGLMFERGEAGEGEGEGEGEREREGEGRRRIEGAAFAALALALALALAAIQTFQTFKVAGVSFDRGAGLAGSDDARWKYITEGSWNVRNFLALLNPGIFGPGHDDLLYFGPDTSFSESCAYLPLGALKMLIGGWLAWRIAAAALGVRRGFSRRDALALAAAGLGFFGLAMALGKYSPLFSLFFHHVPGFNMFRVPARWMFVYGAGFSLVAAVALHEWLEPRPDTDAERRAGKWASRCLLVVAPLYCAMLAAVAFWLPYRDGLSFISDRAADAISEPAYRAHLAAKGLQGILFVALSAGALVLHRKLRDWPEVEGVPSEVPPLVRRAVPWVLPALAAVELALLAWPNVTATPIAKFRATYYPETELVKKIKAASTGGRVLWTDGLLDWRIDQNTPEVVTNAIVMQGLADARGYDPLNARWIGTWMNRLAGLPPTMNPRGYMMVPRIARPPMLALMGVELVLSYDDLAHLPGMKLVDWVKFPEGPLGIWRNEGYRGMAFAAPFPSLGPNAIIDNGAAAQEAYAQRAAAAPTEPFAGLTFDSGIVASALPLASQIGPEFKVTRGAEGPNRFVYETDFPRPAALWFAQSAYPGWSVKIDGQYAPIAVACGTFLATGVEAGKHEVEFEYQPPPGYETAKMVSLAALAAIAFFLAKGLRRANSVAD